MEARRREREAARATGVEQFLQWAEQAVFQFQSLQDGQQVGANALDLGTFGVTPKANLNTPLPVDTASWSRGGQAQGRNIARMPTPGPGDLSSLEDDEPPARVEPPRTHANAAPDAATPIHAIPAGDADAPLELDLSQGKGRGGRAERLQTPAPVQTLDAVAEPKKQGVGLGTKIALLTILVGGVLGGLYAAGVIHH